MTDNSIYFWAHMLDESRHASYYEVYMQEHPEDKLENLIKSLIAEFASDLKKDRINFKKCLRKGFVDYVLVDDLQDKLKQHYHWELIPANTYAAIISRMVALSHRAGGQRFNEADEMSFDDVSHMVSRRTLENCLDIICHNTNVLEANNYIVNSLDSLKFIKNNNQVGHGMADFVNKTLDKNGIPKLPRHSDWYKKDIEDYFAALELYKKWGSYAHGRAGEKYICDSDNGPEPLKKILNSIEYSADDVDLVVALNKSLDVVHFRSDLAAAFVEGGKQTCSLVSNLPDKFVV